MEAEPMRKWLGSAVVALAVVMGGCSAEHPAPQLAPVSVAPQQQGDAAETGTTALPSEVSLPRIGAKSSLIPLGLNEDKTVQVPPVSQPMQAGWYDKAPAPGEVGPAVILGHVDGDHKPGIFYRLKEMAAGDDILVTRKDGKTLKFVVYNVAKVSKKDFPTDEVYGDTDGPELRVITCGGEFDRSAHSYKDNVIVFAKLV
ncbi:class F sortase [Actinocrispum sp. NPDC049592]|uniref:class F sortase n=1 Tax=Actinocrispum sp. NPDC049592 TaxID=3154835 RepID=UPI00341B7B5A